MSISGMNESLIFFYFRKIDRKRHTQRHSQEITIKLFPVELFLDYRTESIRQGSDRK